MKNSRPVILMSGLPLKRRTSFRYQLSLLREARTRMGRGTLLVGPATDALALAERVDARGLILLGYPDQFPDLLGKPRDDRTEPPVYLWAQLSRPARPEAMRGCLPVPLTPKTAQLLYRGGCKQVGPVIPHAVDTRIMRPGRSAERPELKRLLGWEACFVVGAVGHNSRRKRFDLIVRAFARFVRERPDARLVIKTDRRISLDGQDLDDMVRQEDLRDRVRVLTGERTPGQLAELYGAMDLFINLSEWEGFCIPVVEAMACGVPVVTHGIQGPAEILPYDAAMGHRSSVREEDGTVLMEADPAEIAALLLELAGRPRLRARLADAGRREAQSTYDVRRVVELWDTLLGTPPDPIRHRSI